MSIFLYIYIYRIMNILFEFNRYVLWLNFKLNFLFSFFSSISENFPIYICIFFSLVISHSLPLSLFLCLFLSQFCQIQVRTFLSVSSLRIDLQKMCRYKIAHPSLKIGIAVKGENLQLIWLGGLELSVVIIRVLNYDEKYFFLYLRMYIFIRPYDIMITKIINSLLLIFWF